MWPLLRVMVLLPVGESSDLEHDEHAFFRNAEQVELCLMSKILHHGQAVSLSLRYRRKCECINLIAVPSMLLSFE